MSVLNSYNFSKASFGYEQYLDILPAYLYPSVCRLRLSAHSLIIETGRYSCNRTLKNERLCELCDNKERRIPFYINMSSISFFQGKIY